MIQYIYIYIYTNIYEIKSIRDKILFENLQNIKHIFA